MTTFVIAISVLAAAAALYAVQFPGGGQVAGGGHLQSLSAEQFDSVAGSGVVLVDFWASWCSPCRMQLPILEQVAEKVGPRASVMKVNVDEQPELAGRFGVQAIPTLILFRDGQPVQRFVGVQNARTLIGAIDAAVGAAAD